MVPPFAASEAANVRPAQLRLWCACPVHLSGYQPIRFDGALAIPAGSPGLSTATVQPDHAGDRRIATRDAACHGAAAGLQAGRLAPGQPGRAGVDPCILRRLVLSDGLLEPGSILFMAAAPGDRSADGDHAAADDVHQYSWWPGRRAFCVCAGEHITRRR